MSILIFDLDATADAFGARLAQETGWEQGPFEWRRFEDGEFKLRPMMDVRRRQVVVVARTSGEIHNRLIALGLMLSALRRQEAAHVSVVLPCLPYARKDRATQLRDPLSLQWLAGILQASGMNALWTFESHQPAATENAFRVPVHGPSLVDWLQAQMNDAPALAAHVEAMDAVASPDAGGVRRAQAVRGLIAARTGLQPAFALLDKRRTAGKIEGDPSVVGEVAGLKVLVVDDLISSGATLARAASALYRAGALQVHGLMAHGRPTSAVLDVLNAAGLRSLVLSDSQSGPVESGRSEGAIDRPTEAGVSGLSIKVVPLMPVLAAQMKMTLGAG
ncbi:MAG: ribose-phosphate diphosphokinase [Burkholderiaceae bacterium]